MKLSFYDSLSQNQKIYANKVAERARAMGIPPELAVAIAYQESGLNPGVQPGSFGEIGIMQIKPGTAKEMGFSVDDIKDPEKNIDAGLTYLKKSLDMSGGDPRLAAVGYNAGVNHPFFSKEDAKLPDITVKYLENLKGYGAFTPVAESTEAPEEYSKEAIRTEEDIGQERAEMMGTIAGGAAGTALTGARVAAPIVKPIAKGSAALASKFLSPAARQAAELVSGQRPVGPVAPPAPPMGGGMAAGLADEATQLNRILQGTTDVDTGTTGRARMGGFNIETAQQAARAKQAAQNVGALQRAGMVAQGAPDLLAQAPGMTASPSGVLYPRAPAGPVAPPPTPSRGALEVVKDLFTTMMGPSTLGRAAIRYAAPPLAGMQIGSDIGTLMTEAERQEPDYTKMGLTGLSALGAAASLFPMTAPIGIPVAIGAPMIQSYRERMKGALPTTAETVAP